MAQMACKFKISKKKTLGHWGMFGMCLTLRWVFFLSVLCATAPLVAAGVRGKAIEKTWREAALDLVLFLGFTVTQAVDRLSIPGDPKRFCAKSVRRWMRRFHLEGSCAKYMRGGKKFGWTLLQLAVIEEWISGSDTENHRDFYLDELCDFIGAQFGIYCSLSGAHYLVTRMQFTRKKLHVVAKQRDEHKRVEYAEFIAAQGYHADQLVFMDESGTNTRDWHRDWGYSLRSVTCTSPPLPLSPALYLSSAVALSPSFHHSLPPSPLLPSCPPSRAAPLLSKPWTPITGGCVAASFSL